MNDSHALNALISARSRAVNVVLVGIMQMERIQWPHVGQRMAIAERQVGHSWQYMLAIAERQVGHSWQYMLATADRHVGLYEVDLALAIGVVGRCTAIRPHRWRQSAHSVWCMPRSSPVNDVGVKSLDELSTLNVCRRR
jgi:hypothetical protein